MSLYRQPGRVRPLLIAAVAVVALLIGGGVGYAVGHGSQAKPSAADAVAQLRETLRPLSAGLELLPTEYPQALRDSGDESAAVTGDIQRIGSALSAATPDLQALDPVGARVLATRVATLREAVEAKAPAAQIERLATSAKVALADLPGGR
jgi:hypothetical protein